MRLFLEQLQLKIYKSLIIILYTLIHKMSQLFRCLLALIAITITSAAVVQINAKNYQQKINESPILLIYFYSSSCNYCKEFTPVFQKVSKNSQLAALNVSFGKLDGPAFQNLTHSLQVYSYPSILLYRKGINLPIHYRKQRKQKQLVDFVLANTKELSASSNLLPHILNLTAQERAQNKLAIFEGKPNSFEVISWDVIVRRDGDIQWAFVEKQEPKLILGDKQIIDFSDLDAIEQSLAQLSARLYEITEYSWLKMMEKKIMTIIYFNKHGNRKTQDLLANIAKQYPKLNFIHIDGEHSEYKPALKAIGMHDEENIVVVDRKYDVIYVAPSPYSEQGLKQFIHQAKQHKLTPYKKTQKTDKINKLTRNNFEERMNTKQDVLMFLYDKSEPISKQLMKLFDYLVYKLKENKNLLLLRCDVGLNEVEEQLGFIVKPTPKLVFYRNRMKDYPIHFTEKTISTKSVIQFIMENTTFDFEDEWAEL